MCVCVCVRERERESTLTSTNYSSMFQSMSSLAHKENTVSSKSKMCDQLNEKVSDYNTSDAVLANANAASIRTLQKALKT